MDYKASCVGDYLKLTKSLLKSLLSLELQLFFDIVFLTSPAWSLPIFFKLGFAFGWVAWLFYVVPLFVAFVYAIYLDWNP